MHLLMRCSAAQESCQPSPLLLKRACPHLGRLRHQHERSQTCISMCCPGFVAFHWRSNHCICGVGALQIYSTWICLPLTARHSCSKPALASSRSASTLWHKSVTFCGPFCKRGTALPLNCCRSGANTCLCACRADASLASASTLAAFSSCLAAHRSLRA